MKRLIHLFISLSLLIACSDSGQPDLLSEDQMVEILKDIHIARARVDTDNSLVKYRNAEREIMYASVLEHANVDQETFSYSYEYYIDHPVQLDSIYARVIRELSAEMKDEEVRENEESLNDKPPAQSPAFTAPEASNKAQRRAQ